MNETKAVIHEAFYDFIRDAKSLNKIRYKDRRIAEGIQTVDADEVYQRISHIIPKVCEFHSFQMIEYCYI